ncbi:hypothetical protein L5876_10335 [Hyphobacterium sp. SN044]|uniref:hypothetical protein n=1 Tax=Hyphobacterium sp. SN044 TaxID=2912575 RepID=UPI001F2B772D|nr:hypothetical protein [Hyphobacterium sp. SN044]MCF8880213.1 hypothetical protein [Hyphobacterium sp. SN044]
MGSLASGAHRWHDADMREIQRPAFLIAAVVITLVLTGTALALVMMPGVAG